MRFPLAISLMTALAATAFAQQKAASYPRGEAMIEDYFRKQVKEIEDRTLTDLTTKEAWETHKPKLREQFFDMMGLWPLPAKTDLRATITGTVEGDGFVVEKVLYQSRPGLYVTGNLYKPKAAGKYPAILYVCGHGNFVDKGISYGSKVPYQYHPAWFAAHGYVCLILDTVELGEIRGEHHGTYSRGMWWWQSRGYTPAGVELWNGIRGLDYLQSRPDVDPDKLGLTGRSGGGATSWWIAAADERVKAVVPVAGIVDLHAQVNEGLNERLKKGVITGHCDCMFHINTYRWDFAMIAALIAPRPCLLGNSDVDDIFPVPGYRRLAAKVRKVYALYGAEDKFDLLETKGPHTDTPELRIGIDKWMNRWLKNDTATKVEDDLPAKLTPQQLKVFDKAPEGALNEVIHETFVPMATLELPASDKVAKEWWAGKKDQLMTGLREQVFAGWPKSPSALKPVAAGDVTTDGMRLQAWDFESEPGIPLRLFLLSSPGADKPEKVVLSVLDEPGWSKWCRDLGPAFAEVLMEKKDLKRDDAMFAQNRTAMKTQKVQFAAIAPRGIGPTKWADAGTSIDIQMKRRFALIGQTLDGQRVWDVRRAVAVLNAEVKAPMTLHGERDAAGIALYAGLFEPSVAAFDLWHLPSSHRTGPILLNVLKVLDAPQAVALAAPRPVNLTVKTEAERADWAWPERVQKTTGGKSLAVRVVGE